MLDNVESDCRLYGSVAIAESGRKMWQILRESYRPPEKPHGVQSAAPEVT